MNILDLPDDELAKIDPSTFENAEQSENSNETQDATDNEEADDITAGSDGNVDDETKGEDQDSEVGSGDEGAEDPDEAVEDQAANGATETSTTTVGAGSKETQKPEVAAQEESAIDYKKEYEKLLAPFVANGKEIKVNNVADAVSLMQMGANYNKKMAALKPNLKLLKLLESNGLLSEERVGFLIDLEKKNPDAINKLIKESGIDPMDLDAEKANDYKPTVRTVDDKELELDAVLEEIQDTPSYSKTIQVVGKEWDAASKQTVANSPSILKIINSHMQSGVYDVIQEEIERERMFGRLQGLSDIEAYRQVGDAIQARNGFAHLNVNANGQGQQASANPRVVQPKPKKVDEEKLKEKRRAASTAKPTGSNPKVAGDFNPLALSDEEFSKLVKSNFL